MSLKPKRPSDGQVERGDTDRGPDRTQSNGSTPRGPIKQGTKLRRILEFLASGESLNRFQAAKSLNDWCLNSTIPVIQSYGIFVERKYERVPNFLGKSTNCCRYWLSDEQRAKARKLLGL